MCHDYQFWTQIRSQTQKNLTNESNPLQHADKFQCSLPECLKKFKSARGLKYHMNLHNGIADYQGRDSIEHQQTLQQDFQQIY